MYIHIYTTTTSDDELHVWWLSVDQKSVELLDDFHMIFHKMKSYGLIKTYTGDILDVDNLEIFDEKIILMGVNVPPETTLIKLQDGTELTIKHGTTKFINRFNDLYGICCADYDIINTFSYDDPQYVAESAEIVRSTMPRMIPITDNLISVSIMNKTVYMPHIQLDRIQYNIFKINTSNAIMKNWFGYFINTQNKDLYDAACGILESMKVSQSSAITVEHQEDAVTTEPVKSANQLWVEEFCKLYAEKDEKSDTLLSEAYQQYVTASSWTGTETVSMSQFIKYVKEMPIFTIKRKSKGMVVTGFKFVINLHQDWHNKVRNGHLNERNLLFNIDQRSLFISKYDYNKRLAEMNLVDGEYYLEAYVLLRNIFNSKNIKTIIQQFVKNPLIAPSLPLFSNYLKEYSDNPFSKESLNALYDMSRKVVLLNPFAKITQTSANTFGNISSNSIFNSTAIKNDIEEYNPWELSFSSCIETPDNLKNTAKRESYNRYSLLDQVFK